MNNSNTGLGTIGGLYRDCNGSWISAFNKRLGKIDALQAELWAIFVGLQQIWFHGFETLFVQSDCAEAVKLVNYVDAASSPIALVRAVANLCNRCWAVSIAWIPREGNKSADYLAKHTHPCNYDTTIIDAPFAFIQDLLAGDISGPSYLRP
ncbi:hypothetical protein HRI_005192000 [Hibiscus trionum]|uniref:RNase H type-1 domain-containing protein n=1 Tax=Hibiscus trionum TaxID=183268 RepID=A0A9W7JIG6_HIBTR|nr:hypothetical protein HRI_005192000 [Hibiscus trionum]